MFEDQEEMSLAVAALTRGGPLAVLEEYMGKKVLVSLKGHTIFLPLQCEAEGKPRWDLCG